MRRNRGFGNGNAFQLQGGPLLTTHLRDLDIELELLKRKRDLIQQEQALLSSYPTTRQFNNYEAPRNSYNNQEFNNQQFSTQGFSNRFEGPSGSGNFTRPQGTKRQAPVKHWQSPNQKRFAAPQKINPWQNSNAPKQDQGLPNRKSYQPQPNVQSSQIRPLMSIRPSIGQKLQKNFPTQRKDFRPTKVTKAKNQPPKKHTTYPSEETKKLVSQSANHPKKTETDNILRADKPPSVQVKGRMELALGNLMKEIKTEHCSDPVDLEYFQTPFIQRILKQTIRTRIRNVMLYQVVGHVNDVIDRYRKKFPKETDIDLVKIAKDAQTLSSKKAGVVQLIETDDPQEFYRKNMIKVLGPKLDEMFSNLEKLYLKPNRDLVEFMDKMPEPKEKKEEEKNESTDETNPIAKERTTYESIIGECEDPKGFNEKLEKVKMYVEFMDELVEQRLPKILPKFKDVLLSILYTDKEVLSMKALLTSQLKKKLIKTLEKEMFIEPDATKLEQSESIFASDDLIFSTSSNSSDAVVETADSAKKLAEKPVETEKSNDSVKVKKEESDKIATSASTPVTPSKANESVPTTPKTPASEMFFAKLISRPSLPARAVIYDFLNQFKPTSIKKHKSIGNLLVIGFNNKDNYEKILELNETTIGNSTVIIKPSEQVNKTVTSTPQSKETPKSAEASFNESLLTPELEAQITDLLSNVNERNSSEASTIVSEGQDKMDTSENDSSKAKNDGDAEANTNIFEKINTTEPEITEKTEMENNTASNGEDSQKTEDSKPQEGNEPELEAIAEYNYEENGKPKANSTPEKVKELKESGRNTPTRTSSRLANVTPSTIRTRRASRLAQNN